MTAQLISAERDFLLTRSSAGYMRIKDNYIELVNDSLLKLLGYSEADQLPELIPQLMYEQQEFIRYCQLLIGGNDLYHYDLSLRGRHNSKVTVRCEAHSVIDNSSMYVFLLILEKSVRSRMIP